MYASPYPLETNPGSPSAELIDPLIRSAIETLVGSHFRQNWHVQTFQDLIDLASHPCGIFSDGNIAVFAKLSRAANAIDQFETEIAGLRFLASQAGVRVPTPIGITSVEGAHIMVMEAVHQVSRGSNQWRQIGRALAQIHTVKGDAYGFAQQGYFGPTFQDNRPLADWPSFFTERRIWPALAAAINAGKMPSATIRQVERLITRLPDMDLPSGPPTLLHGDAQSNNYISAADGTVVIDPAVYFGCPEFDLAHMETFQTVPSEVFEGYQEILPIDPGFYQRKALWRIPAYLLCVAVEGAAYLPQLHAALARYIS